MAAPVPVRVRNATAEAELAGHSWEGWGVEKLSPDVLKEFVKPAEWDSRIPKPYYCYNGHFLKIAEISEAQWYSIGDWETCRPAPKDRCAEADPSLPAVKRYARCPQDLRSIVPTFYGFRRISGEVFIELEDLTAGMKCPAIVDLKLGTRTYDPFASRRKIDFSRSKYAKEPLFGFRLIGMKVWQDFDGDVRLEPSKKLNWGRTLLDWERDIKGQFVRRYVGDMNLSQSDKLLRELEIIDMIWTEVGSKTILAFSSSLFVAYDAAAKLGSSPESSDRVVVKVIDFGHSFYRKDHQEVEDGVLQGIRNVRRAFLTVLKGSAGALGDEPQ